MGKTLQTILEELIDQAAAARDAGKAKLDADYALEIAHIEWLGKRVASGAIPLSSLADSMRDDTGSEARQIATSDHSKASFAGQLRGAVRSVEGEFTADTLSDHIFESEGRRFPRDAIVVMLSRMVGKDVEVLRPARRGQPQVYQKIAVVAGGEG